MCSNLSIDRRRSRGSRRSLGNSKRKNPTIGRTQNDTAEWSYRKVYEGRPFPCPRTPDGVKRPKGQAMTFDEVLAQVQDLLQREKRVSYRGLKRRFALDDEYLEDLKEELIGAKRLAADEDGRFLVWKGDQEAVGA